MEPLRFTKHSRKKEQNKAKPFLLREKAHKYKRESGEKGHKYKRVSGEKGHKYKNTTDHTSQ